MALSFVLMLCLESALWFGFGFIYIFSITSKRKAGTGKLNTQHRLLSQPSNTVYAKVADKRNTNDSGHSLTQWFRFKIQIIIISRFYTVDAHCF